MKRRLEQPAEQKVTDHGRRTGAEPSSDPGFEAKRKHGAYRVVDAPPAPESTVADTHATCSFCDPSYALAHCAASQGEFVHRHRGCVRTGPFSTFDRLNSWRFEAAATAKRFVAGLDDPFRACRGFGCSSGCHHPLTEYPDDGGMIYASNAQVRVATRQIGGPPLRLLAARHRRRRLRQLRGRRQDCPWRCTCTRRMTERLPSCAKAPGRARCCTLLPIWTEYAGTVVEAGCYDDVLTARFLTIDADDTREANPRCRRDRSAHLRRMRHYAAHEQLCAA